MVKRRLFLALALLGVFAVAACDTTGTGINQNKQSQADKPAKALDEAELPLELPADSEMSDASAPQDEIPFLTYQWDTGFSSFLSAPIEVRRQAKDDCVADGFEIAVVKTIALDGQIATATYICRGDAE